MPFSNFINPYQNTADVPEDYRKYPAIARRFRPDGTYLNTLEDPVTLWAIDILHREYGVPLDAMEVEAVATTDRTDRTSRQAFARADLIIYDDRYIGAGGGLDVAFIMLEAMRPDRVFEGDEDLGWNYHYKQLNIYMAASPSARYAILTSGTNTKIYRRDLEYPRALQEIGDLPKYESARSVAEHSPFKVIINLGEIGKILVPVPPLETQRVMVTEMNRKRDEAKRLRLQAEAVVASAKARVERMFLGEEGGND